MATGGPPGPFATIPLGGDHGYSVSGTWPTTFTWPSALPAAPPRLSDDDVRRIAREVVRQMSRANHDPGDEG